MKFEEMIPHLRAGKKCRLQNWNSDQYICIDSHSVYIVDELDESYCIDFSHLHSDKWEIYEEKTYPVVCKRIYTPHKGSTYFIHEREFSNIENAKFDIENTSSNVEVVKLLTDL